MKHALVSSPNYRVLLLKFKKTSFCPFGAQHPLPVKRNFTQISLTRTSNYNDLAVFEEHE